MADDNVIRKDDVDEKVVSALLRTGLNAVKASYETGVSLLYVKKILKKLRRAFRQKTIKERTTPAIVESLKEDLEISRLGRLEHIQRMLKFSDMNTLKHVSSCCHGDYTVDPDSNETECSLCGKKCYVREIINMELLRFQKELLREWRAEETNITTAFEKLGLTGKDASIHLTQQMLVMPGAAPQNKPTEISQDDKQILYDIQQLPPLEIERLRTSLYAKMLEMSKQGREDESDTVEKP